MNIIKRLFVFVIGFSTAIYSAYVLSYAWNNIIHQLFSFLPTLGIVGILAVRFVYSTMFKYDNIDLEKFMDTEKKPYDVESRLTKSISFAVYWSAIWMISYIFVLVMAYV